MGRDDARELEMSHGDDAKPDATACAVSRRERAESVLRDFLDMVEGSPYETLADHWAREWLAGASEADGRSSLDLVTRCLERSRGIAEGLLMAHMGQCDSRFVRAELRATAAEVAFYGSLFECEIVVSEFGRAERRARELLAEYRSLMKVPAHDAGRTGL